MPVETATLLLTPVVEQSTPLAAIPLPEIVDFDSTNASWIYDDGQPAGLVSSPFLMLVAGLKAFCGQPCGWVNDHYNSMLNCTLLTTKIGADAPSLSIPTAWRMGNSARRG
jgi:hypothetical protein